MNEFYFTMSMRQKELNKNDSQRNLQHLQSFKNLKYHILSELACEILLSLDKILLNFVKLIGSASASYRC